ncbi:unnamed protein product, partial [Ectocarpus fasciculatus]
SGRIGARLASISASNINSRRQPEWPGIGHRIQPVRDRCRQQEGENNDRQVDAKQRYTHVRSQLQQLRESNSRTMMAVIASIPTQPDMHSPPATDVTRMLIPTR